MRKAHRHSSIRTVRDYCPIRSCTVLCVAMCVMGVFQLPRGRLLAVVRNLSVWPIAHIQFLAPAT
jgi:hypothetical protein